MQVRALLYTNTLTNAIMEAMAVTEAAVLDALAHQTTLYPRPPQAQPLSHDSQQQQLARASQPVREALALSGFSGKQWVQGAHDKHLPAEVASCMTATQYCLNANTSWVNIV